MWPRVEVNPWRCITLYVALPMNLFSSFRYIPGVVLDQINTPSAASLPTEITEVRMAFVTILTLFRQR